MIFNKFTELASHHHSPVLEHFPGFQKLTPAHLQSLWGLLWLLLPPRPGPFQTFSGRGWGGIATVGSLGLPPPSLTPAVVSGTSANSVAVGSLHLGGSQHWLHQGTPDTCSLSPGDFTQSHLFGTPVGTQTPSVAPVGFPSAFLWGLFTSVGEIVGRNREVACPQFPPAASWAPRLAQTSPPSPPSAGGEGGGGWGCFHGFS